MRNALLAATALLLTTTAAFAGNNVAPLGFELLTTTPASLSAGVARRGALVDRGVSKYTGGKVLEVAGSAFDVENLQRATFVFDRQERLTAVELQFPKGFGNANTLKLADTLREKYREVRRNVPSVGDAYARYTLNATTIQLDAPHLGFEVMVTYMTTEFEQASRAAQEKERREREQATRGSL